MPPPSVFRGPDAQHYALVHRSQRDPLLNDPDASAHVLHPVQRQNDAHKQRKKKGLTRHELEASLGDGPATIRPNVGEASMYAIYYDDSEYDYMQHLKPVGLAKDAVLLEKPSTTTTKPGQPIELRAHDGPSQPALRLPDSVQPTPTEQMLSYQDHLTYALPAHSAIPDDGLLPLDDDPALREVLEALDDEAYVDELAAGDEFFGTIVRDGERPPDEPPAWIEQPQQPASQWEAEMARFIPALSSSRNTPLDDAASSAASPRQPTTSSKQPRSSLRSVPPSARGSLAGSAFSMSSSAMYRNQGLTDLDDRFDQIEKEYESSDTESEGGSEASNATATPGPPVRADFEEIMDDFLGRFELLGGKMKPVMPGTTPLDKLDTLRSELLGPAAQPDTLRERRAVKEQILAHLKADQQAHDARPSQAAARDRYSTLERDDPQDKWDCQTILSTYSNLDNHPRVIRIRDAIGAPERTPRDQAPGARVQPTIGIDRATGFPVVNGNVVNGHPSAVQDPDDEASDGDSSDSARETLTRDRNEAPATKRARKAALKADRAARRQLKKTTTRTFALLKNAQDRRAARVAARAADVAGNGGRAVVALL
ncbi:hypothetical protein PtA15_3A458 [Puccinia triticina]|uniref:Uncharacterized protein n=1 Tax=Puccinia triticina TaxID=208348 RepID=A0ABY7CCZ6_9BASI|nr:uncharacterized protein PtA15_3A458 [Puccinia triticina]WAQ83091.1 hypothetical protein PtA15_3A458 [Puccinia triticina]